MAEGLRVKLQQAVLERFRKGEVTIRQAAEILDLPYVRMDDLLRENGIPLVDDVDLALERARGREKMKRRRAPRKRG